MQYTNLPPTRRSIVHEGTVNSFGPNQRFACSESVHAFHTRSRGASKIRVISTTPEVFAINASNRSWLSRNPDSMPDCTMPSRSSFDAKTVQIVSFVLPPRSSNVAVSTATWPGVPSNSNVEETRSGGDTSRYSPWNPNSVPSSARETYRHLPPGRTSMTSTVVGYRAGPHHSGISFGSQNALNTRSRGALNTRVIRISRS